MTTDRREWFQITLNLTRGPMPRADRYLRRDGVDYVLAQEEPGQWTYRPANRTLTKIERARDGISDRLPADPYADHSKALTTCCMSTERSAP